MATTPPNTLVAGAEQVVDTKVKREGRFLFFKTTWWETVKTDHVGNIIHIVTERPINEVYLNGKLLSTPSL